MREYGGKLGASTTCVCDPPSMGVAIAIKGVERERNAHQERGERERFWHAMELGDEGGAPTKLGEEVCKLACEASVHMCVEVKREMTQAFH